MCKGGSGEVCDGAAYIKALPNAFSGTYFWAEVES
jgi:hypothetical protein